MEGNRASPAEKVRLSVSKAYAAALRVVQGWSGCCGGGRGTAPRACGEAYGEDAARYDAVSSSFGCGNPLALADVRPGQTVLDLGCGAGLDLLLAAERVGPTGQVIGVDMTEEMVEAARAAARRAGAGQIEVRKGLIEDLPVASVSVDWVISNCVINLSPEKEKVFAEIYRVLKPGGRFSISDMVVSEVPDALRVDEAAWAGCLGGAIPEATYRAGLVAAGLSDVRATERVGFDADQLRALAGDQLRAFGVGGQVFQALAGRVFSVRFTGRRP